MDTLYSSFCQKYRLVDLKTFRYKKYSLFVIKFIMALPSIMNFNGDQFTVPVYNQ